MCVVINDSLSSAKMKVFKSKFPSRFVNVGIAEQNMIGVGNGLANGGMVPYLCDASCFLTARAMEQVKVDLAYSKANVRICGMSSGMAYGQLIHAMALEDKINQLAPTRTQAQKSKLPSCLNVKSRKLKSCSKTVRRSPAHR